jgi:hypothetical protein
MAKTLKTITSKGFPFSSVETDIRAKKEECLFFF